MNENTNNLVTNPEAVFKGDNYRISVLSERLVRLEYSVDGKFSDAATTLVQNRNFNVPEFKVEQDNNYLSITTKYFSLQYLKNKKFIGPKFAPDSNLKVSLINTDKAWFYGQAEARNFKGGAISLDNYSGKINLDKGLYSTDGFVSIDDSNNLEIDSNGFLVKPNPQKVDIYLFMYKRDFGLCLRDYFTLTGYPNLIPRYALGLWWNRKKIYTYNDAKELVNAFNRYQIPLNILLLSEYWHLKDKDDYSLYKTGFTFDKTLFPNPQEFIEYLHTNNVHVGLNFDPVDGIRKEEREYDNVARMLGITDSSTIPFNVLDKTLMNAYVNYLINSFLNMKLDIFWLDYKQNLEGIQGLSYYYNNSFQKSNMRNLTFTRSPLVAPHKAGILYSGETLVSWETLKYLPFYNGLAANKGITWWSHDVGGYKDGTEDSELYLRYVEFSCFNPIFRFSADAGAYYKREPWAWDVKTYTIAKEYCILRQRLIPYLYTAAFIYSKMGRPMIEPIYYSNPVIFDEDDYKNEYFFGESLFIAPITKPKDATMNRSVERIYLPEGIWYDFTSGKKFIGDKRYVAFYKEEEYPVFAREGSIIPMAILDNINDTKNPQKLEINIFPGKNCLYRMYEDDGETLNYQNGEYLISTIEYRYNKDLYELNINPIEGTTSVIPEIRDFKIRFRNTKVPTGLEIYIDNAIGVANFKAYSDYNDFVIDLNNVSAGKKISIVCKGIDLEISAVRIINEDINSIISDLKISTTLKEEIAAIIFSDKDIKKKRIAIRKIKNLDKRFEKMFLKLLEYTSEI